jgi:hypothetical protein
MTSDGISTADWEHVHELAIDIVDAADGATGEVSRLELLQYLEDLRHKYGDLPSLCATQADYVEDRAESERLLLRAFDLAVSRSDAQNIKEVALSLATLNAMDKRDRRAASHWLELARTYLTDADQKDWEIDWIAAAIDDLPSVTEG